jgi:serine/threonine protein kinase
MGQGQGRGRLIGNRYRLTTVVGRGGMGTVWRAHDEVLDRDVAVKEVLLPPGLEANERNILYERTYREARASARLNHPGVVTIHDVVQEDGRPWIIMEFVRARPLQEIIDQDGPLPPAQVAEIGQQLLEALGHAHAAGILHRDVKPSNVMITDDGRAVLTDFGIAQMPGEVTLTQTGLVMGSPAYIAPERAQGDKAIPESDLWALGATLYTAVEGRSPYERGDPMAALAATLTEDPPPPRRAGRLGPVIEGLLIRDPARRMPAGAAMPMLRDVAYSDPSHHPPPSDGARSEHPSVLRYGANPYASQAEETQLDDPLRGRGAMPFDPGSADTVNDPPAPDAATLLERDFGQTAYEQDPYRQSPYGPGQPQHPHGQGPYGPGGAQFDAPAQGLDQTWVAHPLDGATQGAYDLDDDAARDGDSGGERRGRRYVLGGIVFVVGVALIVAGVLLWPKLMNSGNSGGGGSGGQSQSAEPPPAGYKGVTGAGFALAVPNGWTRSQVNNSTFWTAPDKNSFIQVDTTAWSGSSNQQAYRAEADAKRRPDAFGDYSQKRVADTTYRGRPATDWEFTFTAANKAKIHAQDRFVRLDGKSFAIYFRTPDSVWLSSANHLDVVYRTFAAAN